MISNTSLCCIALLLPGSIFVAEAFSSTTSRRQQVCNQSSLPSRRHNYLQSSSIISHRHSTTSLSVLGTGAASILAGSVGGAIGVGVAYPLDTLKTKAQVYGQQQSSQQQKIPPEEIRQLHEEHFAAKGEGEESPLDAFAQQMDDGIHPSEGWVYSKDETVAYPIETPEDDLISLCFTILESEGISGFFGGVKAMMIGQALIKSVAFSANALALEVLRDSDLFAVASTASDAGGGGGGDDAMGAFAPLLLAAAFSGFVTSFLVAPVERVKVMMQAQSDGLYANELECIQAVLENEGWTGLFSRGLGPTLAREVPSYAIYFVVYGILMRTALAGAVGGAAPLVCGAISGCACWVPVYPIDVVKTLVQNTEGGGNDSSIDVAKQLYEEEGVGGFYNGLTPKMLRASVNHAVTFWVYDLMMGALV